MATGIREHIWQGQSDFKTYDVVFFNQRIFTTVTHDPTVVQTWISNARPFLNNRLTVGLDVEWRPSYSGETNPVATLQLCIGSRCLIYQLLYSGSIPQSLVDFLSDGSNTFVGVGIKHDLEKLQTDYNIGGNARYVDLRDLAAHACGRNDLRSAGLKTLTSHVLGREVEKPVAVRTSAWDNRWLTAEQVQYACLDAFMSFEIGRVLNAGGH